MSAAATLEAAGQLLSAFQFLLEFTIQFQFQIVAQSFPTDEIVDAVVRISGFAVLSAGAAAVAAAVFRWYSRDELPEGIGVLIGLSLIAIWLNTRTALGDAILGRTDLLDPTTAVLTVVTFVAGGISADVGRRAGDRLSRDAFVTAAPRTIEDVMQLVRAAGRVTTAELPEEIEDVEGYDPVSPTTKADLSGLTLVFPRRLTAEERQTRLVARLERDYGVGHVDVELAADGTVEYLAVGSRPSGIGPTLAPGSVALAVVADPAPDASSGDSVEVWRRDGEDVPERVAKAELRATAGDVATLAVEDGDASKLAAERPYRLVTLPGSPDEARELVGVLRAADETVTAVRVEHDGPLSDATVGSLPATVLVVDRDDDQGDTEGESTSTVIAFPSAGTTLQSGDVVYALGLPETLRRLAER